MARTSKTRYAVLGMLSIKDASGYELKKSMERSTNHFWREGDGSIYPILKQLLTEEMVSVTIANEDTDKPKKIYSITSEGLQDLQDWLETEPEAFQSRNELLLKIFFGWNVDSQVIKDHVEKSRQDLEKKMQVLENTKKQYFSGDLSRDKLFRFFSLKYGIMHTQASLDWCDVVLRSLNHEKQ